MGAKSGQAPFCLIDAIVCLGSKEEEQKENRFSVSCFRNFVGFKHYLKKKWLLADYPLIRLPLQDNTDLY